MYISDEALPGENYVETKYNPVTKKMETHTRNTEFNEKFGLSTIEEIIPEIRYRAYDYITKYMNKGGKMMISDNLYSLRKLNQLTQEEVSERVGVSRQALAKWENGDTMPDIEKCVLLAELYNVTLDDLVNYTKDELGLSVPPKGKHVFGVVTVGDKGQIVIPHKARKVFQVQSGDRFIVLGDENQGIALIKESNFLNMINEVKKEGEQYE